MEPEEAILKVSLKLKGEDRLLVFSDRKNRKFGEKIFSKGKEICESKYIELEDLGRRPLKEIPEKLKKILENFKPTATVYLAISYPGEVPFRISLINMLIKKYKVRHVHMPGLDERIWNTGLRADYERVKEVTLKVLDLVKGAKEMSVFNEIGTEIYVKGFYRWVPDTGIFDEQGSWGNLPAGEVFTTPKKIEGKFYAEVLGDYFIEHGRLRNPIVFEIESSEVVDIKGRDEKLVRELEKYLFQEDCVSRVGEFAIGTNIFLKEIIGNLLQDEKFPGVHIAFGDPIGELTGADWECKYHLDVLSLKTDVFVDEEKIMEKGRFIWMR